MKKLYTLFNDFCADIGAPIINLGVRIYIAYSVFLVSGLAKLQDYEETVELFDAAEDGDFALPFLSAEPAAFLATAGEIVLPILLILGLLTRFSAAGLLVMTLVIQVFVFDLEVHYWWMAVLTLLIGYGGGKLSLDYWLLKLRK